MTLLSIAEFVGHLHPLLVHFPIGILLLAALFQLLTLGGRNSSLKAAIPVMILWGMLAAIASCISGYLLSQSAEYDASLVANHKWLGIGTAAVSVVLYLLHRRNSGGMLITSFSFAMVLLVVVTGHLGGSLTHGEDYLSASFGGEVETGPALDPIPEIQEAQVYNDIVQPLLEARCYGCHGSSKQKGKLRLDKPDFILKGGEDGVIISDSTPDESELLKRVTLPVDAKKHMPPKEKSQLTPEEIALLHWWVSNGAPFDRKVNQLAHTDKLQPVLLAFQTGTTSGLTNTNKDIPATPVKPAPAAILKRLKAAGVMVVPVALNSNYLSANFITASSTADSIIALLEPLNEQLIWLKLDGAVLSEKAYSIIAKDTALTRLQLSNSNATDKMIPMLQSLKHLRSLNLVNTKVTVTGVLSLKTLRELKFLYLYKTGISNADYKTLLGAFPEAALDSGNYVLPMLKGDTSVVKIP